MKIFIMGAAGFITFNAADNSRWTVREMTEAVAKVTGYKKDIKFVPVLNQPLNSEKL